VLRFELETAQKMPPLHSRLVLLRPLELSEALAVFEAVTESRDTVGKWMSWASDSYSLEDARTWIQTCNEERQSGLSHEFGIFATSDNRFVGVAGFNQFNKINGFCNLGYWIRSSAQRQGYAAAAIAVLREYAFDQLQLSRVEVVVVEGNHPSAAVAERAGAHFEGIARRRLKLRGEAVNARMYSFIATGA
jgi:ribosomal-protein-serine acetyltransferase